MKCTTGIFAAVATATLAASALAGAPAQVFGNGAETGFRFNPGPTVIAYNNCFVNSSATQLDLADVVIGLRRLANAPAVDLECFATEMTFDGLAFNIGTEVSLGTISVPANGAAAVTELLTFNGTGTTLDLETVSNPGLGGFWIGFRTAGPNAADGLNGVRLVAAPAIGASINGFGMFNNAGSGIFEAFFVFNAPVTSSRFFVNVFGELNGIPCTGPASNKLENEPCGDDTNGGCNMEIPAFTPIANGDIYAGNYWAAKATRDTDWYQFTVAPGTFANVNVELYTDGPGIALLVDNNCVAPTVLNVSGFGCPSTFEQLCLPEGTYNVVVLMTVFEGFPCDSGVANNYTLAFSAVTDPTCTPVCGSGDDCCVAQETPGCADETCCQTVCQFDVFCCINVWDVVCADAAIDFCGCPTVCDLSSNECCEASPDGTPGCSDTTCCDAVCAVDVFCCDTEWDLNCSLEAIEMCGCPFIPACPFKCTGTPEGEPCGQETNDGCNMNFPAFGEIACGETICGTSWAVGGTRDTDWFVLTLDAETEITVSITNQLSMVIGVVDTIDCATATALDPFAVSDICGAAEFTVTLPAGEHWIFAGAGFFNGFPCESGNNGYALTITCPNDCVERSDLNGDGCVDGKDIAIVLGNWDPNGSLGAGYGEGDANCDGVVDGFDIAVVLGGWTGCP